MNGEWPYGHMPVEDDLKACGPADANGETRERIQTNGRCESANPRGDTYGPVAYVSLHSGLSRSSAGAASGTSCPRRTRRSIAFDLICILGLALVGLRFGGPLPRRRRSRSRGPPTRSRSTRRARTRTTRSLPAFLIWGFWLVDVAVRRAASSRRSRAGRSSRRCSSRRCGSRYRMTREQVVRAALGLRRRDARRVLDPPARAEPRARRPRLLGPDGLVAGLAASRRSRSGTGGQYHAKGLPDLHLLQRFLQALLVVGRVRLRFRAAQRKTPLQLAALTGVLLRRLRARADILVLPYIPGSSPSSPTRRSRRASAGAASRAS